MVANQTESQDGGDSAVPGDDDFGPIFSGPFRLFCYWLGIALSVTHLYAALTADLSELLRNAIHYAGFAFLCAATYPLLRSGASRWVDLGLGIAVAASAIYLAYAENAIYDRGVRLVALDWIAGSIVILGGIELARRTAGLIIPVIVVLALSYIAYWGQFVPGVFRFAGLSLETLMFRSVYGDDALLGRIASISSTYVYLFIIFGAFLLRSGAGDFVVELARAVAGRLAGGPGMVAVIASALTGTISGSAVANTASTGVITIPLMKKAGFKPAFAGGVEAAASTGGQLMPPIMGAGAFVMASYTLIPYETIVSVAILPALLYFASVIFFVRIEAKRLGLKGMEGEAPSFKESLRRGGASFIIPIGVVIGLLVAGFSPTYAAAIGIASVIGASWLTKRPMGPKAVLDALALGARNMVMTAVLLCVVGLIVNVISTAGIGNTFSLMIVEWSQGNLLIAIVLIALASLVLGMGLPVTAAYIVLATLSAPALAGLIADDALVAQLVAGTLGEEAKAVLMLGAPDAVQLLGAPMAPDAANELVAGLPFELKAALRDTALTATTLTLALLSAHMIIFWLSQDSNVTPPVCLAAFTAAAIAKAPPMRTGFASWKLAKGLYIVPLLFAYTPFLAGEWGEALRIFAFAIVGIYGIAAGLQGGMEAPINPPLRLLALAFGVAAVWPGPLWIDIAGAAGVLALLAFNLATSRRSVAQP